MIGVCRTDRGTGVINSKALRQCGGGLSDLSKPQKVRAEKALALQALPPERRLPVPSPGHPSAAGSGARACHRRYWLAHPGSVRRPDLRLAAALSRPGQVQQAQVFPLRACQRRV